LAYTIRGGFKTFKRVYKMTFDFEAGQLITTEHGSGFGIILEPFIEPITLAGSRQEPIAKVYWYEMKLGFWTIVPMHIRWLREL
jgi:hypothetical protein